MRAEIEAVGSTRKEGAYRAPRASCIATWLSASAISSILSQSTASSHNLSPIPTQLPICLEMFCTRSQLFCMLQSLMHWKIGRVRQVGAPTVLLLDR